MVGAGSQELQRANEMLPPFTWSMNAATSRFGALCDLVFVFAAEGVAALLLALAMRFELRALVWLMVGVSAAPLAGWLITSLVLRNARAQVVGWLASLPFPIENLNSILLGMGETFELYFESAMPTRDEVMGHLARVSDDVFVLECLDDQRMMLARFGVIGSKHNLQRQAYGRYARLREIVGGSLLALHRDYPMSRLRIV